MAETRKRRAREMGMGIHRKISALLLLGLAMTGSCFGGIFDFGRSADYSLLAELDLGEEDMGFLLDSLEHRLYNDLDKAGQTRAVCAGLPIKVKYMLYDKYQVSPLWGLANLYFFGSLVQGDGLTSAIAFGGYAGGVAVAVAGGRYYGDTPEGRIAVGAGAALAVGSFVYGLVRPWFFADEQNTRLRKVLFGS